MILFQAQRKPARRHREKTFISDGLANGLETILSQAPDEQILELVRGSNRETKESGTYILDDNYNKWIKARLTPTRLQLYLVASNRTRARKVRTVESEDVRHLYNEVKEEYKKSPSYKIYNTFLK